MRKTVLFAVLAASIFSFSSVAFVAADDAALEKEMGEIKKEMGEIKREIKALREFLQSVIRKPGPARPEGPKRGKASIKDDPYLGDSAAKVVIVEYSDFQCPYCGRFYRTTLPEIKKRYIDTGKVGYVFKDFPLDFHKQARKAAEAAHCAGEQGKYWEMHDKIFDEQRKMRIEDFVDHAGVLGLDEGGFKTCIDSGRHSVGINEDIASGRANKVSGTPAFLVGTINEGGEVEGVMLVGAQPFPAFAVILDDLLK